MAASAQHLLGGLRTESAQPITTAPPPTRQQPPAAATPARKLQPATKRKHALRTPRGIFSVVATVVLILGWILPTGRYITPQRGVGYWLGIVGGSMMLVLLLY